MDSIMTHIELPNFSPKYDEGTKYGYSNSEYKENLRTLLNNTSREFCMYCFVRVYVDGKYFGHLEHSIEKNNSSYLKECVLNMGWACPTCNDIFKRVGEKQRSLNKKDIQIFEKNIKCKSNDCKCECIKYKNLKRKYIKNGKIAHIILQPNGITGYDTENDLRIQYNIISAKFEPSCSQGEYSKNEQLFIEDHINHFHLNDIKYRTNALLRFLEDVINNGGKLIRTKENNLIVSVFKERLKNIKEDEILKICSKLYTYYIINFKDEN